MVRLSAMGDIIHAMPAITALRRAKPDLQIGWLVEERWAELLCARGFGAIGTASRNASRWSTGYMSPSSTRGARRCFPMKRGARCDRADAKCARMKYEVALDLQGAIRSALAARFSGAAKRIGSSQPREGPARMFYTQAVDVQGTHVVEHALSLASAIAGQALDYVQPPFPVDPVTEAWADRQTDVLGGKRFAILNPGAGLGSEVLAGGIVRRGGASSGRPRHGRLINHGPGEEALAEAVRSASGGVAVPLKCSVGELIALTRRARSLSVEIPVPCIWRRRCAFRWSRLFGPTRPERNGPYGTRSVVLRNPESVDNAPTPTVPMRA